MSYSNIDISTASSGTKYLITVTGEPVGAYCCFSPMLTDCIHVLPSYSLAPNGCSLKAILKTLLVSAHRNNK